MCVTSYSFTCKIYISVWVDFNTDEGYGYSVQVGIYISVWVDFNKALDGYAWGKGYIYISVWVDFNSRAETTIKFFGKFTFQYE